MTEGEFLCIWDLGAGDKPIIVHEAHKGRLTSLVFTPDGTLISCGCAHRTTPASGGKAGHVVPLPQIRLWDVKTGQKLRELMPDDVEGMCEIALFPGGKALVSAHRDRLLIWDLASGRVTRTIGVDGDDDEAQTGGIAVSPDGNIVAARHGDNIVHLWDVGTGEPLFPLGVSHALEIFSTAITAEARLVATGDDRGIIRLWDGARGEHVRRIELGENGRVWALHFSPDGRMLGAAAEYFDRKQPGFRGIVRLWDVPGGMLRREYRVDGRAVQLAFSPDSRYAAVRAHRSSATGQSNPLLVRKVRAM